MDRASKGVFDPRIGEAPSTLFIYLFVWDRYVDHFTIVSCQTCASVVLHMPTFLLLFFCWPSFPFCFNIFYLCAQRYRMVAKDFTLQQSMLPLTRIWVECHERMARWFILMDHKMQAAGMFIESCILCRSINRIFFEFMF